MAGEIVSPGDAFAQSFEGALTRQAQAARQKLLDEIAAKRETRLEEADALDNQIRRSTLQQKMQEDKDREAANFVRRYQNTHVRGDIPDAATLAKAAELGVEDIFREDTAKAVAAPPSQTMTLPGSMGKPSMGDLVGPPAGIRLAPPTPGDLVGPKPGGPPPATDKLLVPATIGPSQSEARLKGPQTYGGTPKEQESAEMRQHAQTLLDALEEGPEKEALKFWLATGKEPPAALLGGGKGKQTFTPEPSYVIIDAHGKELPGVVSISGGKAYLDGEPAPAGSKVKRIYAPQQPIQLFNMDPVTGDLSPGRQLPPHSQVRTLQQPHLKASDLDKLTPAQQLAFKDIVKRKTTEATNLFPSIFGSGIDDDTQEQIFQEAYAEAKKVGAAPAAPGAAGGPKAPSVLDKLKSRPTKP